MTIATLGLGAVLVVLVFWLVETITRSFRQVLATWRELYDDFGVIRYGVQAELRGAAFVLAMKLLTVVVVCYVGVLLL